MSQKDIFIDTGCLSWYFDDTDYPHYEVFYMNTTKRARFCLTLSMIIFGTLAPFVRNITVSSGELALYRAILAAVLIGSYLLLTKQQLSCYRKDYL